MSISDSSDWTKYDTEDKIFVSWSIEEVREIRPDLTDEQCRKVLRKVKDGHDANLGISWDILETVSYDMYPIQV